MRFLVVAAALNLTSGHRNLHYSVLDVVKGRDNSWSALQCEFPEDLPAEVPYALRTVVAGGYVFTNLHYNEDSCYRSFPTNIDTGVVVRVGLYTPRTTYTS